MHGHISMVIVDDLVAKTEDLTDFWTFENGAIWSLNFLRHLNSITTLSSSNSLIIN